MIQELPSMGRKPERKETLSWIHNSWAQVVMFLLVQIGGLTYFVRGVTDGELNLQNSVDSLTKQVDKMGIEIQRLAIANERIDEHMRSVDSRLNRLEEYKDGRSK